MSENDDTNSLMREQIIHKVMFTLTLFKTGMLAKGWVGERVIDLLNEEIKNYYTNT